MLSFNFLIIAISVAIQTYAYDQLLGFNDTPVVETRSIDEVYQAALAEGGIVTCWHGGDTPGQQDKLKNAFEQRFPGMSLNITVDVSKYHDGNLDRQLAVNDVYVDSVILQTLQDYPRWKDEGALLKYAPLGFETIYPAYRDADAAYYEVFGFFWSFVWNTQKSQTVIQDFNDVLKPEYKDKLVLTYPNDDDAVLFTFYLILQDYGLSWFESLLEQNPRWVRGTAAPIGPISQANDTAIATFTSTIGLLPSEPFNISFPSRGQFTSWPQTAAILKDAPHSEGAKLFHAYYLSDDYQKIAGGFSVRTDFTSPGQPFDFSKASNTDPTAFKRFMTDRSRVERLRFFFEDKIGTAQGPSPLQVPQ